MCLYLGDENIQLRIAMKGIIYEKKHFSDSVTSTVVIDIDNDIMHQSLPQTTFGMRPGFDFWALVALLDQPNQVCHSTKKNNTFL